MTRKHVETDKGKKKPSGIPSTGRGAASALDALIKRRVAEPPAGNPRPPAASKKH